MIIYECVSYRVGGSYDNVTSPSIYGGSVHVYFSVYLTLLRKFGSDATERFILRNEMGQLRNSVAQQKCDAIGGARCTSTGLLFPVCLSGYAKFSSSLDIYVSLQIYTTFYTECVLKSDKYLKNQFEETSTILTSSKYKIL